MTHRSSFRPGRLFGFCAFENLRFGSDLSSSLKTGLFWNKKLFHNTRNWFLKLFQNWCLITYVNISRPITLDIALLIYQKHPWTKFSKSHPVNGTQMLHCVTFYWFNQPAAIRPNSHRRCCQYAEAIINGLLHAWLQSSNWQTNYAPMLLMTTSTAMNGFGFLCRGPASATLFQGRKVLNGWRDRWSTMLSVVQKRMIFYCSAKCFCRCNLARYIVRSKLFGRSWRGN